MDPIQSIFSVEVTGNIARVVFHRAVRDEQEDLEIAKRFEESILEVLQQFPHTPLRIFLNLLALKHSDMYSKGRARRIYIRLFSHPSIAYVAVAVQNSFFSILVEFYVHALKGTERFKIFHTEKEALEWLISSPRRI